MAASSGVRCATFFDAASTFLNNDATVPEESAARPKLLPASEMKSRRVRSCTPLIRAIPQTACNHCLRLLSQFAHHYLAALPCMSLIPVAPFAEASIFVRLWRVNRLPCDAKQVRGSVPFELNARN